jgi:hypothetical protein
MKMLNFKLIATVSCILAVLVGITLGDSIKKKNKKSTSIIRVQPGSTIVSCTPSASDGVATPIIQGINTTGINATFKAQCSTGISDGCSYVIFATININGKPWDNGGYGQGNLWCDSVSLKCETQKKIGVIFDGGEKGAGWPAGNYKIFFTVFSGTCGDTNWNNILLEWSSTFVVD